MQLAKQFADIDSVDKEPAETRHKGFMPVGSISGAGTVTVSAFEAVVPARQLVFHGVRFEVTSGGEYPTVGVATVSLDNVEKLLASIEQLANAKITTNRFALTEIETEVDGLQIVVFNTERGRLHASVKTGGVTCFLSLLSELNSLHKLVSLASEHLKQNAI